METVNHSQEDQKTTKLYPSKLFQSPEDVISDGIASDTYVRGLILGHCDLLQHPVVIMQKNADNHNCECNNTQKMCENTQFCNKGKYSRIESRLFYTYWADYCKQIRKNHSQVACCRQDEMVADYLLSNLGSLKSESSVTISDGKNSIQAQVSIKQDKNNKKNKHVLLRYECPISHYDEMAININVEGIEGVLIIGQFLFQTSSQTQIAAFKATAKEHNISESRIQDMTSIYLANYAEVKKIVFDQVTEIEHDLKKAYHTRIKENASKIQNSIVNAFQKNYNAENQRITEILNPIERCSKQYDCAISALGTALSELTKASSEINNSEELLFAAPISLNDKDDYVIHQGENEMSKLSHPELYSVIRERCHTDIQEDFITLGNGYFAYCIPLVSGQKKYIFIIVRNQLETIVQTILKEMMGYICLRITELIAKFNEAQIKVFTKNMRHELGQLNEAVLIRINGFEAKVSEASLYLNDDHFIQDCVHILDDYRSFTHSMMLRNNTSKYFSEIPRLTWTYFYPYESFLYKWRYIYTHQAENKNIRFIMDPVELADQSRPLMYADISMIEQVTYNLTNNAFKYSLPGTTITLDCRLNADRTLYQIIVSSYGWPINLEEQEKVFLYGFRGEKNKDREGSGIGLYLSRRIAEEHGGTLNLSTEHVSSFDVSCLYLYEDMPDRFKDTETEAIVRLEMTRLHKTEYDKMIRKPVLKNDVFTPYYIKKYINKGTMRYEFILSIPYRK